ncbi:MAG: (Fe-S)-binding protein [Rhodospirillaceae bacterium]|jgi:Fe-S-cluster-containing hydrogenase component 2|nr:(Fe-S)-binding protein [Rhodospirillaceae bacterium]|tara:strand:- start:7991 stop:8485 length:495 start_codon:yes stop_codon:yes gene_type:complete
MENFLLINPSECTGCMQCEMACSFHGEGAFNPAKSRIKVFEFKERSLFVPYTCTQCNEAWCMTVCPADAISVDGDTGAKVVDDDVCVGCKVCTIACPFGTVNYNADTGKVIKCDLCGGEPACVEICPTTALSFVDAGQAGVEKMREWAGKTDMNIQTQEQPRRV